MTDARRVPEEDVHLLEDPWPDYLNFMDSDPARCMAGLYHHITVLVRNIPPPRYRSRDKESRQDIASEVFLHLIHPGFRRLRRYENRGCPFSFFLRRSLINRTHTVGKHEKVVRDKEPLLVPGPQRRVDRDDRHRRIVESVKACLGRLNPAGRMLVDMAAREYRVREMALILEPRKPDNKKVSDQLRYCRRVLRRCLKEKGIVPIFKDSTEEELDHDA